jgi:hypothetical protein
MANKKFTGEAEEYDERFVRCRGLRNHTWLFETDFNVATGPRGRIIEFERVLHCAGCTTDRIETFTVTKSGRFQRKGHPKYVYADGYQVHRGNPIDTDRMRDQLLVKELTASLDAELLNRLLNMRPEARKQVEAQGKPLRAVAG